MAKGNVFTGARARLKVGGVKVGYATDCDGSEEIQTEAIEVFDNIEVAENVAVRYRVRFTMGFVRIVGQTVKSLGWFPTGGVTPEERLRNILTSGELTVVIEDNQTGQILMQLEQATATSRSFRVGATGVVGENVEFVAIRMRDESEV